MAQDISAGQDASDFRVGPAFALPARFSLFRGILDLRASLETHLAPGAGRLLWTEEERDLYQDDQPARIWATHLLFGPEVHIHSGGQSPVAPYLGATLGPGRARTTYILEGDSAWLLDTAVTEESPPKDFLARSGQWVLSAGAHGGVRFLFWEDLAAEVEAGYTVTFVPQSPLSNTLEGYSARQAAYGLDVFQLGLCVSYSL